jgi:hypothetical protein
MRKVLDDLVKLVSLFCLRLVEQRVVPNVKLLLLVDLFVQLALKYDSLAMREL